MGNFAVLRAELEAFDPDLVVIWGDDQYENYKLDCVPPFCVGIHDKIYVDEVYMPGTYGNLIGLFDVAGMLVIDTLLRRAGSVLHRPAGRADVLVARL